MIKKTSGAKTFLTSAPVTFNGVQIPKGSLMKHEDDGWALLRLTPFSFDRPDDKLAFGSEINKALDTAEPTIELLGSVSLRRF